MTKQTDNPSMHHITIQPGLSDRDRATLIGWTNRKGANFLRQWAGPTPHFPLTPEQVDDWSDLYTIFRQGRFVGIIQEIRREQDNVHIGRFVLDPALTGRGIGRAALLIFMDILFRDDTIRSITLNVFDHNLAARKLYERVGFEVLRTIESPEKKYTMIKHKLTP